MGTARVIERRSWYVSDGWQSAPLLLPLLNRVDDIDAIVTELTSLRERHIAMTLNDSHWLEVSATLDVMHWPPQSDIAEAKARIDRRVWTIDEPRLTMLARHLWRPVNQPDDVMVAATDSSLATSSSPSSVLPTRPYLDLSGAFTGLRDRARLFCALTQPV